jgi:anion-transporting  ArsA/GET3 family ATPase
VAASLALWAAQQGRRVLLCETSGSTRVAGSWRVASQGYTISALAPRLFTMSITSGQAIEDYLMMQLHFRRLYKMVFRNRIMGPFVDAVPGLHDLIQLGKVFDLERATTDGRPTWDLIVIDAPATGHGLSMLASPRAMMDLTAAGPFFENAKNVAGLYEDPSRTAVVLVSLPEEMPVNETLDLWARLGPMQPMVRAVVLNELHPNPLPDPALYTSLREHLAMGDAAARDVISLADATLRRAERQDTARHRLGLIPAPRVDLPFLFRRDLDRHDIESFLPRLGALG